MSAYDKYRRKPLVVEARRTGCNYDENLDICHWCGGLGLLRTTKNGVLFFIDTLEEEMLQVMQGDWILRDNDGEFHVCTNSYFEALYERAP